MYYTINVIQFTSSVSPLKWVDVASLRLNPAHFIFTATDSCHHQYSLHAFS